MARVKRVRCRRCRSTVRCVFRARRLRRRREAGSGKVKAHAMGISAHVYVVVMREPMRLGSAGLCENRFGIRMDHGRMVRLVREI